MIDTTHPHITPESLRELRSARGESLAAFGRVLARTIDPAGRPYSKTYIHLLENARKPITPEIAQAVAILGAMLDGAPETQARARSVTILSTHDLPPGTINTRPARPCRLAGCRAHFLPASPRQLYCSPECRAAAYRRRNAGRSRRPSQKEPIPDPLILPDPPHPYRPDKKTAGA
jgi:hypothetical protein